MSALSLPAGRKRRRGITEPTTAFLEARDGYTMPQVDEPRTVSKPDSVERYWVEDELDATGDEQLELWEAAGHADAREFRVEAAGLAPAADADKIVLDADAKLLDLAAREYYQREAVLGPFRRRAVHGKFFHLGAKACLLAGDIAGISLVGITLGDDPLLAFANSVSGAAATVIAGTVGSELRDYRMAQRRARPIEELDVEQRRYSHYFLGSAAGMKVVACLVGAACIAGTSIALAIGAGRATLEGSTIGLLYGGIALAVAIGSLIESYMWADEVADAIDSSRVDYGHAVRRHRSLSRSSQRSGHARNTETAASIADEYLASGKAANSLVKATKFRALRTQPGIAGHGQAATAAVKQAKGGARR